MKKSKNIKEVIKLKNIGREGHTYLSHIINNYDKLADITIFLPGSADSSNKYNRSKKLVYKIEKTNIDKFNELKSGPELSVKDFQNISVAGTNFYSSITVEMLDPTKTDSDDMLSQKLGSPSNLPVLKKELFDYLNLHYKFNHSNVLVNIYNLKNLCFKNII